MVESSGPSATGAARPAGREIAAELARLLDEHKGADTVVLDVGGLTTIADWFVITTARSSAHLAGLARELDRYLHAVGLRALNRHKHGPTSGWMLVDCGDVIVHLMERAERDFYDLERLWFRAERVPYSSKSS
jgi:ribosome-associated protein